MTLRRRKKANFWTESLTLKVCRWRKQRNLFLTPAMLLHDVVCNKTQLPSIRLIHDSLPTWKTCVTKALYLFTVKFSRPRFQFEPPAATKSSEANTSALQITNSNKQRSNALDLLSGKHWRMKISLYLGKTKWEFLTSASICCFLSSAALITTSNILSLNINL